MTSFQCEQLALFHNNQFYTSLNAVFLFFFPAYVLLGYNRDDFKNSLQGIKPEFCNLVGVFQNKRGSLEASSCVGSQVWYKLFWVQGRLSCLAILLAAVQELEHIAVTTSGQTSKQLVQIK